MKERSLISSERVTGPGVDDDSRKKTDWLKASAIILTLCLVAFTVIFAMKNQYRNINSF